MPVIACRTAAGLYHLLCVTVVDDSNVSVKFIILDKLSLSFQMVQLMHMQVNRYANFHYPPPDVPHRLQDVTSTCSGTQTIPRNIGC